MDLEKRYTTSEGIKCNILQMVKMEPEWAANRIQAGEKAKRKANRLDAVVRTDELAKIKNVVAKRHEYPENILGTRWEFAMHLEHRRKKQIQLYEEVIAELSK